MKYAALTLNPCIDKTLYFSGTFSAGKLNRAENTVMSAGGKGVNVSRVLKKLGETDAPSFGFRGGETGGLLLSLLEKENLQIRFTESNADTRMCIKMIDGDGICTEANEPGGPFTEEETQTLFESLLSYAEKEETTVFLGGSIPRGIEKTAYRTLTEQLKHRGARVILDADGDALKYGLEAKPFMIKPNDAELSMLTGRRIGGETREDRISAAASLARETAKTYDTRVLCTLGADGAIWTDGTRCYAVNAPKVPLRGFTGAGDTFLAAFVHTLSTSNVENSVGTVDNCPEIGALRYGASAAAAKVASPGTEIPEKEAMEARLPQIFAVKL